MCKSVREKTPYVFLTELNLSSLCRRVQYAVLVTSPATKVCWMLKSFDLSVTVWLFSSLFVLIDEPKMLFFFSLNSLNCGSSSADRQPVLDASISLLDALSVTIILTSLSCSKNLWEKVTESYLLELWPPPPPLFRKFGPGSDIPQLLSLSLCPCLIVSQPFFITRFILSVTDLGSSIDWFF